MNNEVRLILVVLLVLCAYISPLESSFLPSAQAAEDAHSNIVENTQDNILNRPVVMQSTVGITEEKFRVGPTIRIRPLNDVVNRSADGIIEIYLENPGINDISLTTEVRITVPSGIDIYGQGFGDAQAAGVLYAKMVLPPGGVRTAYINIKAEKTGNFYAQLSGMYYPGVNKREYQSLSFTYPFIVKEPSPDPKRSFMTNPEQIPTMSKDKSWWNRKISWMIIAIIMVGLICLGYRVLEIKYRYKMELKNRIAKSKNKENK